MAHFPIPEMQLQNRLRFRKKISVNPNNNPNIKEIIISDKANKSNKNS